MTAVKEADLCEISIRYRVDALGRVISMYPSTDLGDSSEGNLFFFVTAIMKVRVHCRSLQESSILGTKLVHMELLRHIHPAAF